MTELIDAVGKFQAQHEPRREVISGWMADPEGYGDPLVRDETTEEPTGYYYCMIDRGDGTNSGDFIKVWGGGIRPVAGWPVLIGTTRERPWELSILTIDKEAMGGGIDKYAQQVEPHHETHEWGDPSGSDDVVYSRFLQLYDFSVWPVPGTRAVTIADGVYDPSGQVTEFPYTTLNLEAHAPSGTGTSRWVIVCLDPTGIVQVYACPSGTNLDIADICQVPHADWWELAAVKLWEDDSSINMLPGSEEVIDLRFARLGWPQHGGLGSGTNWENVYIVAQGGGDFDNVQDGLNIALGFDAVWVMPGNYTEDLSWPNADVTLKGWATEITGPYATLFQGAGDTGPILTLGAGAGGSVQGVIFNRELFTGAGEYVGVDASDTNHNLQMTKCRIHIAQDVAVGRTIVGMKLAGRLADGKESSISQSVIIAETDDGGSVWETAVELTGSNVLINDSYLYGDLIDTEGTTVRISNTYIEGDVTGTTGGTLYLDAATQITGTVSGWDNVYQIEIKGAPHTIYNGVKATIAATFSNAGMIAYATDTGELGYYDGVGAGWNWGDMSGSGVNWGNTIIVAKSGGDYTTITAALIAASAGDCLLVMAGDYVENITMVDSVSITGMGKYVSKISGSITFSGTVDNCNIYSMGLGDGAVAQAVIHSSSGTANFAYDCHIQAAGGGGIGYGVNASAGTFGLESCYVAATGAMGTHPINTTGTASMTHIRSYAATINHNSSGTVITIAGFYGSAQGTGTFNHLLWGQSLIDAILPWDGAGSGLDADLLDGFNSSQAGGNSVVVVTEGDGDIQLAAGDDYITDGAGKFRPDTGAPGLAYRSNYFVGTDGGEGSMVDDHFNSYPASGFSWAGAPFVTPGVAQIRAQTQLEAGVLGATSARAFYYVSSSSSASKYLRGALSTGYVNTALGLRMDDGTDNNYVEVIFRRFALVPQTHRQEARYRTGGGAVNTVAGATTFDWPPSLVVLKMEISGTPWSSWSIRNRQVGPMAETLQIGANTAIVTWTPTRVGILFDQGATGYASWERFLVDWVTGL